MDTNTETNKDDDRKEIYSFYNVIRRIMLAGVGAIALKHDELEEFIDKLVERGEIAKKDGEELLKEMKERRKKYFESEESTTHKKVAGFFDHFSPPTKNDLDELNKKISALEEKIDKLIKAKK